MAVPTVALLKILTARRHHAPQSATRFTAYEPDYREILAELYEIAGGDALDELTAWVTERTRAESRLPAPPALAARARTICEERDLAIPDGSVLADETPTRRTARSRR